MKCEFEKEVLLAILYAMTKYPNKEFRIWAQGWIRGQERDYASVQNIEEVILDDLYSFDIYKGIPSRESLYARDSALWATEAAKALMMKQYDLVKVHANRAIMFAKGHNPL